MYLNNNKKDTNIDENFKEKKILNIFHLLNKYKLFIIIFITIILIIILLFTNKKNHINSIKTYLVLSGEETITLYQGTDYIEPGYEAYNSKNENLTSKVNIESNLNINQIGEYEITYTINDTIKIRKINIIEKNKEYTYIYLKPINNDINVYLEVGDKYKEPGYQVFNSTGKNLNDSVKITGKVDTSKKGIYKLTYSIIDSNNVNISATRNIIVIDTDISLSLSQESYTNQEVIINIKVIDEYFDHIILPNGTKITKNTYSYSVNKNGTYKFTTHNKKGVIKEASIKVNNIDKEAPTGRCSGSYQNGISTINIDANDNTGIKEYVLNNISYNKNKITIKEELNTANITIYDKAGNQKRISCNLENKNQSVTPQETPQENPLESIYTSSNSHQNSINGIRYIMYDQADPRWGKTKYSNGKTIAEIGCLITSMAVISSAGNHNVTPLYIFQKKANNYYMTNAIPMVAGKDNFKCVVGSITHDKIVKDLSSGKVGIIKVEADSVFTANQHYMSLIDISADRKKIFIGNSYGGGKGSYNRTGWFDIKTVLTDVHEYVVCTPTQKLIDKFK